MLPGLGRPLLGGVMKSWLKWTLAICGAVFGFVLVFMGLERLGTANPTAGTWFVVGVVATLLAGVRWPRQTLVTVGVFLLAVSGATWIASGLERVVFAAAAALLALVVLTKPKGQSF